MKKRIVGSAVLIVLTIQAFATKTITIGTGDVSGIYYPTGGAICRIVNKNRNQTGMKCFVESTKGSVSNVNAIKMGKLDFGISQSDTVYQAYHGEGKFKDKTIKGLRSVIAIYPELLAFVVNRTSGIHSLYDMKGKKINIGISGSGTHMTTDIVMDAFGIKKEDLASANELGSGKGPKMLGNNKIDGYFGMYGHPAANIEDAADSANIDLVPIKGKPIDELVAKYPYYAKGVISGSFYKGVGHDTPSIGVKAVLITKENMDNKRVYTVVKAILDHFDAFKKMHPVYKMVTKASLLDGLAIPQHPGAVKAFREAGLIK